MRHAILATATGAFLLCLGSLAGSQTPTMPPGDQRAVATPSVKLSMEQEHIIKEGVKDLHIAPETAAVPETVGASVPDAVTLRPLPADIGDRVPQVRSHRFFLKDDRVFLVDPKDNSIADVIN